MDRVDLFPSELTKNFGGALLEILRHLGVPQDTDGIDATPARVLRALAEMTEGFDQDPALILGTTFEVDHADQMIVVRGAEFASLCEHHLMPFVGRATIAYLPGPGARVVGLSKLPRLLNCFARRTQTQERLTMQVTAAIDKHLDSLGSACIVRATHGCMAYRGVRSPGEMVTSSLTGVFLDQPSTRAELLSLS